MSNETTEDVGQLELPTVEDIVEAHRDIYHSVIGNLGRAFGPAHIQAVLQVTASVERLMMEGFQKCAADLQRIAACVQDLAIAGLALNERVKELSARLDVLEGKVSK